MKNSIFKIISAITVPLFAFSCVDLDLPSDGRLTMEEIFNNYQRTKNFYNTCRNWMPQVGFTYGNNTSLASYCDEAHDAGDGMTGSVSDWYNNRTSPFNNPLGDRWNHYFEGIRKCNVFLASITDPALATANISDDEKNGWIAEVRVMRAFYYLQLIKRYGGVPLIETPYDVDHDFSQDRRATFEECADLILNDCDMALATPETEGRPIGFRWSISDNERGLLTRAFAYAVKSQTALYAASPLWFTTGSKYTWQKAAEITKEALDQCLLHGFELFNVPVDADVAQNPYAYYFIQRSDPSRSVDRETIYETTSSRTNVWRYAGTPITPGMEKAGAGPSQELVDSYEMAADGTLPILGYSDANHLQPIPNPASSYDPLDPYEGRDPRFYASIYYNGAPRSLSSAVTKEIFPVEWGSFAINISGITKTEEDGYVKFVTTNTDPHHYTGTFLDEPPLPEGTVRVFTFEYKSNRDLTGAQLFWCVGGNISEANSSGKTIQISQANDWTRFEYSLDKAIDENNFGKNVADIFRFDPGDAAGYEIYIRNLQVEVFTPPPPAVPVETFVDGNCGISDRVMDIRYTRTGYYMRKFNNYRSGPTVDADGLMKIFRLGELYLNFAEAAYQAQGADVPVPSAVGGYPLSARDAVNIVRARVSMPLLPAGLSNAEFEKRYRNERRVEMAFEEHRFFDVRRWKILNETDAFVTGMRITQNGAGFDYTRFKLQERGTGADKYLMYPIQQSEVAKMEEATGIPWQNPGWN
ncbi:MAG: RagB/SusD family nutrient uptake outer membrane protein [Bacteroidales bacterium]|nr:RagB/SusD family nutrient uptake outer membrane protein [Bacteroidales bacterium]